METVQLKLMNQVTELNSIALKIEELSELWNIPAKTVMEINLVLEELFTNVVFYAFEDAGPHEILLEIKLLEAHTLQLRLEDDGKPFNLLEKEMRNDVGQTIEERQIGGLGIHFIKEMMKKVEYERFENTNVVILTKNF